MQIRSIGIDLGKTTFHLIALGSRSQVVIRKKFSRSQLLTYTANLPSSLIGMEAGVGSHFLGRALQEQGHEVCLIPAQFVRPFVKSNKNALDLPRKWLPQPLCRSKAEHDAACNMSF